MPLRPASVSPPLKIYEIKLDRAAVDAMPSDARRNLFLFGHVANEINTLSRLLIFSVHKHDNRIEATFGDARATSILRFLIGATREGYLGVERSILKSPFGKTYLPHLKPEGIDALNRVRKNLADMSLLAGIRNAYSFHLPDHAQLDNAYGKLPIDVDLHVYSGAERHSSLNEMSHTLMLCGMLELVPGSASMTDNAAMDAIVADVLAKSVDLNDLIEQIVMVLVEQHKLSPEPLTEVAIIDGPQSIKTFTIPPLLRN
jgi:hypothetical protein